MKTIFILCGVSVVLAGALLWYELRPPSRFGTFVGAPKAEVSELVDHPKEALHKTFLIEGIIREQCTSMGCYFFFHEGKRHLRVDLADIAMTAPRRNGHRAEVEGQMVPFGDGYQFWASAIEFK